jgi:DNA-binding Lrp family transcriptional regulator
VVRPAEVDDGAVGIAEEGWRVQAFVLIQAGVGMASRVGQAVGAIQGVRSADIVTGPYDVVVRVEAASIDALGRLVVSKIQAIEGVTRTLTCPVVRL